MTRLTDLEYLKLGWFGKLLYNLKLFFCGIPVAFANLGKKIAALFVQFFTFLRNEAVDIFRTFVDGNIAVKLSFLIMGLGNICYGQVLRGILFLLFEAVFILYMITSGAHWLSLFDTLGDTSGGFALDEEWGIEYWVAGDDSFKILLYGLLTIIFIIALIYTWRLQIKQCRINMQIKAQGKRLKTAKDDMRALLDEQLHKTLLALPVTGILLFTVLPIIFMILVAFTNYDAYHDGYSNLFTWVGLDNFNELLKFGSNGLGLAFGEVLSWTLMWAFFATFSNYFLGMGVAILINKKGIKFKKFWRTVLVMTIAIPQFVSLIYVSHLFDPNGFVSQFLLELGLIDVPLRLWEDATSARILIIIINIWIGIPYLMLIATGILMNIPQDLYESARIDGASVWQQYMKITLPYMMFVTGPHLLTSFVNNLNNFNVIYLLTGGDPANPNLVVQGQAVGHTDLLITWLFDLTTGATSNYKLASVVGIMIFVVVAVLSLIVYNVIPSTRNEEDFK